MKELIAQTGEPVIPAVVKYFERAKLLDVHELTQAFKYVPILRCSAFWSREGSFLTLIQGPTAVPDRISGALECHEDSNFHGQTH